MQDNPLDIERQRAIRIAVKKYLQANNISAAGLAGLMGLKTQTVVNYLSKAEISPRTVKKMSDALNYPYDMMIQGLYWEGESKMQELERRIKAIEDFLWPEGRPVKGGSF